ncbi:MAG: DUF2270 domain-containing protein [Acidobacteriota bacterium]
MDTRLPGAGAASSAPGESSFHTSMAHLYRGEMHRMTVWRQRLDVTSNWAILMVGGLATFTLGSVAVPHFVLLLGLALMAVTLTIEARRYRRLHHSRWRLRLLESCYFAPMLETRDCAACEGWRQAIAHDLREPVMFVSWFTAIRVRLRRNYLLLLYFITAVWIAKLFIHPRDPENIQELWARLTVEGFLPSWFVALSAAVFLVAATALAATAASAEAIEEASMLDSLSLRARCRHD